LFNPQSLLDPVTGQMLPMHQWPPDAAAAIGSFDVEKRVVYKKDEVFEEITTFKPRAVPKIDALKLLGQYFKLFADRHELTGADGQPLAAPSFGVSFPSGFPGAASSARPEDNATVEPLAADTE
jgi:hypothetical protein